MSNAYKSIARSVCAELEEKKSRFIAQAHPVLHEAEALSFLQQVKAQHPCARHHVYAYVLRENTRIRYSDDGEPQKTAGLPVLEVIQGAGLSDVIIVVTRYFGGTLLGTGGLVRAYTQAAQAVVRAAEICSYALCYDLDISCPYHYYDQLHYLIQELQLELVHAEFSACVRVQVRILMGNEDSFIARLTELFKGDKMWELSDPYYALCREIA